jgi:hypothetical protein
MTKYGRRTALLAVLIFLSCETDKNPWIVRVLSHEAYREDFLQRFRSSIFYRDKNDVDYETLKDYADKAFADDLLFIAEGYALHLDEEPAVQKAVRESHLRLLAKPDGPYYSRVIHGDYEVTEKELLDLYKRQSEEIKIAQLAVRDSSLADSLYRSLLNGAEFEKLVNSYSAIKPLIKTGGIIDSYFVYADNGLSAEIEEASFGLLKIGDISPPVKSPGFFNIIRLVDRRKRDQKPFTEERQKLTDVFEQRKLQQEMRRYVPSLYEKFKFTVLSRGVALLQRMTLMNRQQIKALYDHEESNPEKVEIVSYDDQSFTVIDVYRQFPGDLSIRRKRFHSQQETVDFLIDRFLPELILLDARQRKILESADVRRILQKAEERLVGAECNSRLTVRNIKISQEEVDARYDRDKARYEGISIADAKYEIRQRIRVEKRLAKTKQARLDLRAKYKIEYNSSALHKLVGRVNSEMEKSD